MRLGGKVGTEVEPWERAQKVPTQCGGTRTWAGPGARPVCLGYLCCPCAASCPLGLDVDRQDDP